MDDKIKWEIDRLSQQVEEMNRRIDDLYEFLILNLPNRNNRPKEEAEGNKESTA